jgi:hypothetical protein
MAPVIDAEIGGILGHLSEQDCRDLSRLCAVILEGGQPAMEAGHSQSEEGQGLIGRRS